MPATAARTAHLASWPQRTAPNAASAVPASTWSADLARRASVAATAATPTTLATTLAPTALAAGQPTLARQPAATARARGRRGRRRACARSVGTARPRPRTLVEWSTPGQPISPIANHFPTARCRRHNSHCWESLLCCAMIHTDSPAHVCQLFSLRGWQGGDGRPMQYVPRQDTRQRHEL